MTRHHPQHVAIAKTLGVTPASLRALLAVKAGRGSMNRGAYLYDKGLVSPGDVHGWKLTDAGADLLTRARALGY
jgi:hypothetical protein